MDDDIVIAYRAAYAAVNGTAPKVERRDKRYYVTNHRGDSFDYSERELSKLAAGLAAISQRSRRK